MGKIRLIFIHRLRNVLQENVAACDAVRAPAGGTRSPHFCDWRHPKAGGADASAGK